MIVNIIKFDNGWIMIVSIILLIIGRILVVSIICNNLLLVSFGKLWVELW